MVASLVTLFKKLKFGTDENVGWGPIDLPELELQTTAYWVTAERGRGAAGGATTSTSRSSVRGGRSRPWPRSCSWSIRATSGSSSQVRSPHQESPTIYLYEAMPGGVGLSERLFARHDELVAGAADLIAACSCDSGCPACTGPRLDPEVDAKALALRLLGRSERPRAAAAGRSRRGARGLSR